MTELASQGANDAGQAELEAVIEWTRTLQLPGDGGRRAMDAYYLGALAQRALTQPEPVRRRLLDKLRLHKAAWFAQLGPASLQEATCIPTKGSEVETGPLAALTQQLDQNRTGPTDDSRAAGTGFRRDLKSVSSARTTWSKLSASKQLGQALLQAPKNAGPLNSHRVALQTLTQMREISPDYFHRFVTLIDTLVALDPVQMPVPQRQKAAVGSARGARSKASGRP